MTQKKQGLVFARGVQEVIEILRYVESFVVHQNCLLIRRVALHL
jgi:hypothetical protein